jgi:hypothetical protein
MFNLKFKVKIKIKFKFRKKKSQLKNIYKYIYNGTTTNEQRSKQEPITGRRRSSSY